MDKHIETMAQKWELTSSPVTAQVFGNAGREHMQKYGKSNHNSVQVKHSIYSSPCLLRLLLQPENFGIKLEVVLKWRDIFAENIILVSLIAGLKMEGIVKWRGFKSQRPLQS